MRVGSLFSGVGGFDLGFERAGMELAWHSEIEPHACAVLRDRWPDVPNLGDVTKIDGATIPPVDVICGGFPCQDLSVAGKRRGFEGERSVLAFEFLRIVREMREATDGAAPTFLVLENVPGLFTSAGGRDFGALLDALGDLRPMDVAWRVLDSRFFGVAQRRRRVFVVVDFGGERCDEVLALREGLRWNPPSGRAAREDVAGTLGGGSSKRGWSDDLDRAGAFVAGTLNANHGNIRAEAAWTGNLVAFDTTQVTSSANRSVPKPGDPCHPLAAGAHAPAVAFYANMGKDARSDGASVEIAGPIAGANGGNKQAVAFQESQTGCREYEEAGTLRANGPGHDPVGTRVRSASGVRRLTPRETERLQAFPDDWTRYGRKPNGTRYELADGPRYKCMGNAVTVSVAEWIGKRIAVAVCGVGGWR